MAEYPSLPLFTDAFIADTIHLNAAQTGAYLMLLMCAWRSKDCTIPNDDKILARFSRMSPKEWAANRDVILSFWDLNDDGEYFQKRLTDERSYANDRRDQATRAGKASAKKRKKRHSTEGQQKESSSDNRNSTPVEGDYNKNNNLKNSRENDKSNYPIPENKSRENDKSQNGLPDENTNSLKNNNTASTDVITEGQLKGNNPTPTPTPTIKDIGKPISKSRFNEFWEQYPRQRRGSKQKAEAAYRSALKRGADEKDILSGLLRYACSDEVSRGYAKGAAAWLNDDRWTIEYELFTGGRDNAKPGTSEYNKQRLQEWVDGR